MSRTYWASAGSERDSDEYESMVKDLDKEIELKEEELRRREIEENEARTKRAEEEKAIIKRTRLYYGKLVPKINFDDLPISLTQRKLTESEASKIAVAYSCTHVDEEDLVKFKKYFNENLVKENEALNFFGAACNTYISYNTKYLLENYLIGGVSPSVSSGSH